MINLLIVLLKMNKIDKKNIFKKNKNKKINH